MFALGAFEGERCTLTFGFQKMRVLYSHVFLLFSSQREVDQFLFCGLLRRGRQTERWR